LSRRNIEEMRIRGWLSQSLFVYLRINKVQKAQILIKINKGYE